MASDVGRARAVIRKPTLSGALGRCFECSAVQIGSKSDPSPCIYTMVCVHAWSFGRSWKPSFRRETRDFPPPSRCWLYRENPNFGAKSTSPVSNVFSMVNTFELDLLLFPPCLWFHGPGKVDCLFITRASQVPNLKTFSQSEKHNVQLVAYCHLCLFNLYLRLSPERIFYPPSMSSHADVASRCRQLVGKRCLAEGRVSLFSTSTDIIVRMPTGVYSKSAQEYDTRTFGKYPLSPPPMQGR